MSRMIGIDLGTTNSLVTEMTQEGPQVLANELGETLIPSALALAEDGHVLVGRAARDRMVNHPDQGIAFFKRDMGTAAEYHFGNKSCTPTECSAHILRELKRIAELHSPEAVSAAVITVPAYFHDTQRQATLDAAEIAGLSVERILNEPTAAALAFGFGHPDREGFQLIFDLGGGTFDVTLLEVFDGVIEIRASGGVSRLGGEDFTDALLNGIIDENKLRLSDEERSHLRQQLESVKRRLSDEAEVAVDLGEQKLIITQQDFVQSSASLMGKLRPVVRRCFRDANVDPADLVDVLLVGGATRMPFIRNFIAEEIKRLPNQSLDPDRVVGIGAAVQAALCQDDEAVQDLVLTDVCPHTLGTEVVKSLSPGRHEDGYFHPLIDRNTTIPVSRSESFSTVHPQQDQLKIKVFQGESRLVKDNQYIGELTMKGMRQRSGKPDSGLVEVRFSYDMNGILEVEVTSKASGKKISKVFEDRPGSMTKKEIEEALKRMQPLKTHPRDLLPNRARLERASRLYEDLSGANRDQLDMLVTYFESALESQDGAAIAEYGAMLDSFMSSFYAHEAEKAPLPDEN